MHNHELDLQNTTAFAQRHKTHRGPLSGPVPPGENTAFGNL